MHTQPVSIALQLRQLLAREVQVLREVLSNLCEEERQLAHSQPQANTPLLQEREVLLSRLTTLRKERQLLTGSLRALVASERDTTLQLVADPSSIEILSLGEQIVSLATKIRDQSELNNQMTGQQPQPQPAPQTPLRKTMTEEEDLSR